MMKPGAGGEGWGNPHMVCNLDERPWFSLLICGKEIRLNLLHSDCDLTTDPFHNAALYCGFSFICLSHRGRCSRDLCASRTQPGSFWSFWCPGGAVMLTIRSPPKKSFLSIHHPIVLEIVQSSSRGCTTGLLKPWKRLICLSRFAAFLCLKW